MYDCIVIGGGVIGSSAAYHLAKSRKKILLLDQFSLPHTRGSSHGPGRIYRSTYRNPLYAEMALEALDHWRQLEKETGIQLYTKTGILVIDKPPFASLNTMMETNKASGVPFKELSPEEVQKRYPGIARVPEGCRTFLDQGAGVLRADKALDCFRIQIKKFGGTIQDREKVVSIIPGSTVTVKTEKGEYHSKSLIITPGVWICKLLKPLGLNLPIQAVRVTVCFWKEPIAGRSERYPVFIDYAIHPPKYFTEPAMIYGLPSLEYPGLRKIGIHQGVPTDPDSRDDCTESDVVDFLLGYMRTNFPEYGERPSIVENCMYSRSPDEDYIIDTLPHHPNVAFGCGFSGHGFKVAPVVGRILTELALGETLSHDISCLRMKRFPGIFETAKY